MGGGAVLIRLRPWLGVRFVVLGLWSVGGCWLSVVRGLWVVERGLWGGRRLQVPPKANWAGPRFGVRMAIGFVFGVIWPKIGPGGGGNAVFGGFVLLFLMEAGSGQRLAISGQQSAFSG